MSVSAVHAVWFSGTGTTEKTVTRIARRLAEALGAQYNPYSYTLPEARQRELTIPAGDLAVVGCPTYAGRVPNLLMPYLRDMVRGSGALAVPVVLFGNRNYDDALMELSQLLTAGGFTCVAGAAFVGEHSFSRTLGAGRPNDADAAEMDDFAGRIAAKLAKGLEVAQPHRAVESGGKGRSGCERRSEAVGTDHGGRRSGVVVAVGKVAGYALAQTAHAQRERDTHGEPAGEVGNEKRFAAGERRRVGHESHLRLARGAAVVM